ncbi:Leucine-rich repeat-containing protein 4B [Holothuria leucospilota]|uniref:Leucine-rich repeat-containing protein 4B n=1 Tax=Holothuria leucospilota TaxID=206669 RepID=A0A9Q0YNZ7_HOLLE|nr:Leucine-rich repeat-containing protein 4B [Holothuria leucospilota]
MIPALGIVSLLLLFAHFVSCQSTPGPDVLRCIPSGTIVIDCSSSRLKAVPKWLNRTLEFIELRENEIQIINRTDFAGFSNLKSLSLRSNLIYRIEEGAFSDLTKLEYLRLDENQLTFLTTEHFTGLSNLRSLTLNNNEALTIDPCLFSQLPFLKTLQLHQTKVNLNNALIKASSVCFLQYPSAFLNSSTSFSYVSNLTILTIGFEGTSSNATYLQNFESLIRFTIDGFPSTAFHMTDLSSLQQLESLALVGISEYPQDFVKSDSVIALQITQSTFLCLPKNAFENLPSLQRLTLIRNSLNMIDSGAFDGANTLTFIDLSFNKLVSLPRRLFDHVGTNLSMPNIILEGNLWHCDCRLKWLQNITTLEDLKLVCSTPIDKAGIPLSDVVLQCESGNEINQSDVDICPTALNPILVSTPGISPIMSTLSPSQDNLLVIVFSVVVGVLLLGFVIICLGYWQKTKKVKQLESGITLQNTIQLQQIQQSYFENRSSSVTTETDVTHSRYERSIHRQKNGTPKTNELAQQSHSLETMKDPSIATYLEIE